MFVLYVEYDNVKKTTTQDIVAPKIEIVLIIILLVNKID